MFLRLFLSVLLLTFYAQATTAQKIASVTDTLDPSGGKLLDQFQFSLGAQTIFTTSGQVPYGLRANRSGSIPLDGASGSLLAHMSRDYQPDTGRLLDWGFSLDGRINQGYRTRFLLIEGYAKARLSIFQLKAGRSKDFMGLADSTLSTGAFAVSGNAPGIPKVELSIPEFWELPLLDGLIAVKGNFVHGWMGETPLRYNRYASVVNSYYHQKSFYGRLGKPDWRLKFYAGFNHQAMWGEEDKILGPSFGLSDIESFYYVVIGKAYREGSIPRSKIGNHIGSIDQAMEIDFSGITLSGYHQFFYAVGGLFHLNNLKDGLFGLSIKNKKRNPSGAGWHKLVFEFLNSKSQGGEPDAKITPSGDEDYYNNFTYTQGWSYQGENLGNPLLTNRNYMREDLPAHPDEYFVNNRVTAFHAAGEGHIKKWQCILKLTYSRNYGTYNTSPEGSSRGSRRFVSPPPYFKSTGQFSGYIEAGRGLPNGYRLGFALAIDQGELLYNSAGGFITLSKSW